MGTEADRLAPWWQAPAWPEGTCDCGGQTSLSEWGNAFGIDRTGPIKLVLLQLAADQSGLEGAVRGGAGPASGLTALGAPQPRNT